MPIEPCVAGGFTYATIGANTSLCAQLQENAGDDLDRPVVGGSSTPEVIRPDTCPWSLARKWKVDVRLAKGLVSVAGRLPFSLSIISGYRSPELQRDLAKQGRPAAPVDVSTHTWCPATGADIAIGVAATRAVKARVGLAVVESGLRWGGGSPVDSGGIPSDWNHVDLGPRV